MRNGLTAIGWRGVKYEPACIMCRPAGYVYKLTMGLFAAGFSSGELELACAISQSTGHVVLPVNSLLRRVRQLTYDALKRAAKEPLARTTPHSVGRHVVHVASFFERHYTKAINRSVLQIFFHSR